MKLNIGSNAKLMEGWINIDIEPMADVQHDARTPFPYPDNSVFFIFSEHFIEHLNEPEGKLFFKECFRILKPGGVIRTSTFCIDEVMENMCNDEKWNAYKQVLYDGMFKNWERIAFFNLTVYQGGYHKHMYNNNQMIKFLLESGFTKFNTPQNKKSIYPELCDLEWRQNSVCIVEAIK